MACFDARFNTPRIGRILKARGRAAADVAITTTFGPSTLTGFKVCTDELVDHAKLKRFNPQYHRHSLGSGSDRLIAVHRAFPRFERALPLSEPRGVCRRPLRIPQQRR
jgi:hypothetical protein